MIVLDASSAVEFLGGSRLGAAVAARIRGPSESLHAPHLLDLEVAQAYRRAVSAGVVSSARARRALENLALLDLIRYPHDRLLPRVWELRHNFTAYDASYVALAEALDCPLLTCDDKLRRAVGTTASVELVAV